MRTKIIPLHDTYVPTAEFITAHEDALIANARRETLDNAISVLNLAMPKPVPKWASAYLGYLLLQRIEA